MAHLCGASPSREAWPDEYLLLCRDLDCNFEAGLLFASFLEPLQDVSPSGGFQTTAELFVIYDILAGHGQ
eukprot:154310-Alexandrium_andersonii.AAC.1